MKFEITLRANFWNKSPHLIFIVNNNKTLEVDNFIDDAEKTITFEADVKKGNNQLIIHRANKTNDDTLVDDGKVIKDSTVEILEVLMDRYVIGRKGKHPFLLDSANYFPEYPEPWFSEQKEKGEIPPASYKHCQTLHHNGQWKLDFEDPVAYWFFEFYSGKRKFR